MSDFWYWSLQGYNGAAVGKGRQLAKTELEKLKLNELSMHEAVMEAARMYALIYLWCCLLITLSCSIYLVHDDAKEKEFELEISWIGPESNYTHTHVPKDLFKEAEAEAKAALETFEWVILQLYHVWLSRKDNTIEGHNVVLEIIQFARVLEHKLRKRQWGVV